MEYSENRNRCTDAILQQESGSQRAEFASVGVAGSPPSPRGHIAGGVL